MHHLISGSKYNPNVQKDIIIVPGNQHARLNLHLISGAVHWACSASATMFASFVR